MIQSVPSIIHRLFQIIRIRYLLLFLFSMLMVTSCARPRTLNLAPAPVGSFDHRDSHVELPSSIENAPMTGYLVRPSKDGRYPCVVLLHGKGGWWQAYIHYARKLARHGFSSLVINYYSVHQVDLEGLRTPFMQRKSNFERQNEDINRAVSAFAKSTHCIQNEVGLIGFSLGADKAFRAAASLPVVKAVIAYYGPYDYEALIQKRVNAVVLAMATGDLLRWKEYLEVHSPANKIQNTRASALMFHGVTDRLIPVQQSFTMMRKLRARESGYAQLKLYEGTGHNFVLRRTTPREREDSIRLALIFLKNHLSHATEPPHAQGVGKKRVDLHSTLDKQDS